MDELGPYGAPRDDGNDIRWGADFLYVMDQLVKTPTDFEYVWGLLSAAVDQGSRDKGKPNPFWREGHK